VLAACLIGGIGNGLVNVQTSTLLQLLAPTEVLGQVGGFFQSTAVAGQLLGAVLTPILVPLLLPMGTYFTLSTLALAALVGYLTVQLIKTRPGETRALTTNAHE
jgi:MFS family permease